MLPATEHCWWRHDRGTLFTISIMRFVTVLKILEMLMQMMINSQASSWEQDDEMDLKSLKGDLTWGEQEHEMMRIKKTSNTEGTDENLKTNQVISWLVLTGVYMAGDKGNNQECRKNRLFVECEHIDTRNSENEVQIRSNRVPELQTFCSKIKKQMTIREKGCPFIAHLFYCHIVFINIYSCLSLDSLSSLRLIAHLPLAPPLDNLMINKYYTSKFTLSPLKKQASVSVF